MIIEISAGQLLGAAVTVVLFLAGLVWGLLKWAASKYEETARHTNSRLERLTERVDQRHEEVWKTLGAHERELSVYRERDKRREEDVRAVREELERRLSGMHGKISEVSGIALQLQAAARAAEKGGA